ncbi:MAG: hypothetical protein HFG50_11710 [Lachnospiraceae bacterium]|nr:hypothetical protein [Lachnospiraceae bacterium]
MMKRCIMLLASAMMVLLLAACTPTTEKNQESQSQTETPAMPPTTEAVVADTPEKRNAGNENLPSLAAVSVYRVSKNGDGLVQEMDNLESEELVDQALVDLMVKYEILEEGTEIISFELDEGKGTLNLNQLTSSEDEMRIRAVTESVVNTFTENFELESGLILQINGEVFSLEAMEPDEDGTMYYNADYRKFE